jgi:DNA-binding XRE family transcriptional regulator
MTVIQFIEREGHAEFAIVPIEIWERLAPLIEDLEDEMLFDQAKSIDDGLRVPASVLDAELSGTHPVKAWREYRGLTQDALSQTSGISTPYLSQIEKGKRTGTAHVLSKIAHALDVSVELLFPKATALP